MGVSYSLGCNFDPALISAVAEMNASTRGGRVDEFYGSTRADASLSARPTYRLPPVTRQELSTYLGACREAGILFNYTLNTPRLGSKREVSARRGDIKETIKTLLGIGVDRFTVASPLMAELVREVSEDIPLEVSTIAHIDTVTQIKFWHDRYIISAVCGSILKNRNIRFLMNAAAYCQKTGLTYRAIVNEFCGVGSPSSYGTHCIYRDSCYLCHAENVTPEDDALLNYYPMERCISARKEPATWLKMPFIRPEDTQQYARIGIDAFKITGRTGSTEFLLQVAAAYMKRHWDGNLLLLWKNLETIVPEISEEDFRPCAKIPNTALNGFMTPWFRDPDKDCANEVCGETCRYCDDFLAGIDT